MQMEMIEVPKELRCHIIGKNGRKIKEIEQKSNAKVKSVEEGFRVTGTEDQVRMAKGMIESIREASYPLIAKDRVIKEIQVPLYMKRFMTCHNKRQKLPTFDEIREKTKTGIEHTKEGLCLIGIKQEHIQAAEDMINELQDIIKDSLLCVKVPDDPTIIPLVIGENGENVIELQKETQTYIQVEEPYFYIQGETKEQQHKAKLKIKEIASSRRKMKEFKITGCQTMMFVDDWFVNGESDEFSLRLMENPPSRWLGCHYKIVGKAKVNVSTEENRNEGLVNLLCERIHQTLRQLHERHDRDSFQIDFLCQYGNVYVKDVDEDKESPKYSVKELKTNLKEQSEAWKTTFDGGLKQLDVDNLVEALSSDKEDAVPPFTRYDFSIISPSCRKFIIKVYLREDNGELKYSRLDPEINEIQGGSYKLVDPPVQHMKIHVILLNTDIDCSLHIQTKFKKGSYTPEDGDDELNVLKKFLDERLKNGSLDLDLIKPNDFPKDYDLNFWRKSERRIFKDDGFTITVSKEESENVNGFELGKNVVHKKDVQIHLNNSDKKLSIQKCQSAQTSEDAVKNLNNSDELSLQKEHTGKYVRKVLSFARTVHQHFF